MSANHKEKRRRRRRRLLVEVDDATETTPLSENNISRTTELPESSVDGLPLQMRLQRTQCQQYNTMLKFMERHGDLSRPRKGVAGRREADHRWIELAAILNETEVKKPCERWKKVWADWKANTKRKFWKIKSDPQNSPSLKPMEKRLMAIRSMANVVPQEFKGRKQKNPPTHTVGSSEGERVLSETHYADCVISQSSSCMSEDRGVYRSARRRTTEDWTCTKTPKTVVPQEPAPENTPDENHGDASYVLTVIVEEPTDSELLGEKHKRPASPPAAPLVPPALPAPAAPPPAPAPPPSPPSSLPAPPPVSPPAPPLKQRPPAPRRRRRHCCQRPNAFITLEHHRLSLEELKVRNQHERERERERTLHERETERLRLDAKRLQLEARKLELHAEESAVMRRFNACTAST